MPSVIFLFCCRAPRFIRSWPRPKRIDWAQICLTIGNDLSVPIINIQSFIKTEEPNQSVRSNRMSTLSWMEIACPLHDARWRLRPNCGACAGSVCRHTRIRLSTGVLFEIGHRPFFHPRVTYGVVMKHYMTYGVELCEQYKNWYPYLFPHTRVHGDTHHV